MFFHKKSDSPTGTITDTDTEREQDTRREQGRDDGRHTAPPTEREQNDYRRDQFGGLKAGAVFYGWLVAVALTILLVGVVGAGATAFGSSLDVTQSEAELRAGSIGMASAIAILATLAVGYLAGGYVAGRLARFNGVRQGSGVWLFGLVITLVIVAVGGVFGAEYNVFDRASLPSLPVRIDKVTASGILTVIAVLVGTLIAAAFGGMFGQHYHGKIDRTEL